MVDYSKWDRMAAEISNSGSEYDEAYSEVENNEDNEGRVVAEDNNDDDDDYDDCDGNNLSLEEEEGDGDDESHITSKKGKPVKGKKPASANPSVTSSISRTLKQKNKLSEGKASSTGNSAGKCDGLLK